MAGAKARIPMIELGGPAEAGPLLQGTSTFHFQQSLELEIGWIQKQQVSVAIEPPRTKTCLRDQQVSKSASRARAKVRMQTSQGLKPAFK